ncbi:MAG: glycosyltransferase family 4 protein [Ornithinimicrobium sp.]
MRVGLVNPYSLDVPGGVQAHVVEFADFLLRSGHEVSLLTPAEPETVLPEYAVSAGRAVPVRYNGSVARLAFGPAVAARVRAWVDQGTFDVVHIHEPASPSVSLLALWAVSGPIVATFHSAQLKSRSLRLAAPMLQPGMDKISGRIAVSRQAAETVSTQLGGACVVIPNGLDVARFAAPEPRSTINPVGSDQVDRPRIVFLGRFTEPRKGLAVLLNAVPAITAVHPGAEIVIAGPGDPHDVSRHLPVAVAEVCTFLGALSELEKANLLRSADVYVAPNLGGESFGIILVEAMAAGAPVVASNLPAFVEVLDGGRAGALFERGDAQSLAAAVLRVLGSERLRAELSRNGPIRAGYFDWSRVGRQVLAVYDSVRPTGSVVGRHRSSLRRSWKGPPSKR